MMEWAGVKGLQMQLLEGFLGIFFLVFCVLQFLGNSLSCSFLRGAQVQYRLSSMFGVFASLFGSWLLQKYMLNVSWRRILMVATVAGVALDATPTFLTIFGVVRNEYFYLGESVVSAALP